MTTERRNSSRFGTRCRPNASACCATPMRCWRCRCCPRCWGPGSAWPPASPAWMSPMVGLVVFMAGAFGFMFAIEKTKNSAAWGGPAAGLHVLHGPDAVAAAGRGADQGQRRQRGDDGLCRHQRRVLRHGLLSTVVKRDLSGLARFLFIGAIGILVVGIANVFIQSSALMMTLSVLAVLVFSAFILVDLKRVRDGEETNYISATLGVYLSLYNVFQSLLVLFGMGGSRRLTVARAKDKGPRGAPVMRGRRPRRFEGSFGGSHRCATDPAPKHRGRRPRCFRRAPCAGTCSPRRPPCSGSLPGAPADRRRAPAWPGCS
jgi:modulator of FtsH protease